MFGFFSPKKKAIKDLSENIRVLLVPYDRAELLIPTIKSDPYIAGYIMGRVCWFVIGATKNKLSQQETKVAAAEILFNVFEDKIKEVSTLLKSHATQKTQDYESGNNRALKLSYYFYQIDDVTQDPDYAAALAWSQKSREQTAAVMPELLTDQNEFLDAIVGLEGLWFNDHMNRLFDK